MSNKQRLITELLERNIEIERSITKLQHDLRVNKEIISHLRNSSDEGMSESSEEFSIEILPGQQNKETKNTEEQVQRKNSKKQERKEGLEKARAWALDRAQYRRKK
jgi:hypothetical protein